jgi:hypothetical protein
MEIQTEEENIQDNSDDRIEETDTSNDWFETPVFENPFENFDIGL